MMRSAAERSSRPLKFWLLGNFLSADFRASVHSGALARAVGASVELVTYGWPAHLRYQNEKQRLKQNEMQRKPLVKPNSPLLKNNALQKSEQRKKKTHSNVAKPPHVRSKNFVHVLSVRVHAPRMSKFP